MKKPKKLKALALQDVVRRACLANFQHYDPHYHDVLLDHVVPRITRMIASGHADAILTGEQVAAWLQVHPRALNRLGVPVLQLGFKTIRYSAKVVAEWLDSRLVAADWRKRRRVNNG